MIAINLAPLDKIENKNWYFLDLIFIFFILSVCWFLGERYVQQTQDHLEKSRAVIETLEKRKNLLKEDLKKIKRLKEDIDLLTQNLQSIEEITSKKQNRYLTVMVLEVLQNLKPDGLWFNELSQNSSEKSLHLTGTALHNILIAKFMTALGSTFSQETDLAYWPSQIFFPKLSLKETKSQKSGDTPSVSFSLDLTYDQK